MNEPWQRPEIDSPCTKVCIIHRESGLCMGCYRTSDEIAAWSTMPPAARRQLMQELPKRAPQVKGHRKGGRKGGARGRTSK